MAVTVAEGEVVFTADTSRLSAGVNSGIDNAASSASGHGSRAGKLLGGAMKVGLGVALAGAGGIAAVIKTGFDEASDASAGNAQLAAGIKSTGNAAGVTVASLNKMAGALQNSTGQTDDSITAAQSLLLTFTNISNSGPDKVFDRATVAAADMAARMGGDASSNAILLGKALNDPAKGVSRLTKVGVTFTDQQKAQIAAMQQAGDVAGAQGVILNELGKEFGGSAKAAGQSFPGTLARLKRSFEDFSQGAFQSLVPVLIPAINIVIGGLQKISPVISGLVPKLQSMGKGLNLAPIGAAFSTVFSAIKSGFGAFASGFAPFLTPIMNALGPLIPAFAQLAGAVSPFQIVLQALQPVLPMLGSALGLIGSTIATGLGQALPTLVPLISTLSSTISGVLSQAITMILPFIMDLVGTFADLMPTITSVIGAVVPLATSIIGALVPAIMPLVGVALPMISQALGALVPAIMPVVSAIMSILVPVIRALLPVITTVFQAIVPIIQGALNIVVGVIKVVTGILTGNWSQVWSGMKQIVSGAWGVIKGVVVGAINIVKSVIGAGISLVSSLWQAGWSRVGATVGAVAGVIGGAVSGIVNSVRSKIGEVVAFFTGLPGRIMSALGGLASTLSSVGGNMIQGLINGIKAKVGDVVGAITGVANDAINGAKSLLGIHSPSTVFKQIGVYVVQGFSRGIRGSASQAKSAITRLHDMTMNAFSAKAISKGAANGILVALQHGNNSLNSIVAQRTKITARLKTAQKNLATITKEASTFKASIISGITAIDPTSTQNGADYIQTLRDQLAQTKSFTTVLAQLKKAGLDKSTYRTLATKGIDALPIAQSILDGGKTSITAINSLDKQLSSSAGKLATTATNGLYGAGVQAAKGIVQGLQSQESQLNKAMKRLATSMVRSIKSELGIHSPSKLMHDEVGVMMGRGISGGLAAEIPNIRRGVVQGVDAATRGVKAEVAGARTTAAAVSQTRNVSYTIVEAEDPMGTLGRIAAADRKWGSRKS